MNQRIELIFLVFMFFSSCQKKEEYKIVRVEMFYVSFDMTTMVPVNCFTFDSFFPVNYNDRYISIEDKGFIEKLNSYIHRLKVDKDIDIDHGPDVRIKVVIYREKYVVDYLCLGGYFGITYNNKVMKNDLDLHQFIVAEISARQPN
jgi:hypothetical protein